MSFAPVISNAARARMFGWFLSAIAAIAPVASGQTAVSKGKGSPSPKAAAAAPTVAEAERTVKSPPENAG